MSTATSKPQPDPLRCRFCESDDLDTTGAKHLIVCVPCSAIAIRSGDELYWVSPRTRAEFRRAYSAVPHAVETGD